MTQRFRSLTFDSQLEQVVASCTAALEFDQYICLQDFYEVLVGMPAVRLKGISLPSRRQFEAMLEAECWDSAALAIISNVSGFMISLGQDGTIASVLLPGQVTESTESARTVALAICASVASALQRNNALMFERR